MKRSELNSIIEDTIKFMEDRGLPLPPFAYWGVPEWKAAGKENEEIVENMLGWDITDFGSGDFEKIGLTIFTFRNGNFYKKDKYPKPYAEKLLLVGDGQILPYHYHYYNIFMGNPLTSGKDLSISLLKLLECRMQWYIDFITWTSRPYFRLITGFSFAVFVLCRLNHIRCIRVTHSSLNR